MNSSTSDDYTRMQPMRTLANGQMADSEPSRSYDNESEHHNLNINRSTLEFTSPTPQNDRASVGLQQGWPLSTIERHQSENDNSASTALSAIVISPFNEGHVNLISSDSTTCTEDTPHSQELSLSTRTENDTLIEELVLDGDESRSVRGSTISKDDFEYKTLDETCDENMNIITSINNNSCISNPSLTLEEYHPDLAQFRELLDHSLSINNRCNLAERNSNIETSQIFIEYKLPKTCSSPEYLRRVQFTWQPTCLDTCHPCVLNRLSPPIWTSIALRDNALSHPDITNPIPQVAVTRNGFAINPNNIFEPIRDAGDENLRPGSTCKSGSSEDAFSPICIESRRESEDYGNGLLLDCCDECRFGGDSDDDEDDLVEDILCSGCHYGYVPALGDLENFIRMLPSIRESPVVDELSQHDPTGNLESSRPGNPVAECLKHGGNEHFLPIDYVVQDGMGQEL